LAVVIRRKSSRNESNRVDLDFQKWESEQKRDLELKRQEDLRAQYEKEQDILNNK
jgi:hypothetical protein